MNVQKRDLSPYTPSLAQFKYEWINFIQSLQKEQKKTNQKTKPKNPQHISADNKHEKFQMKRNFFFKNIMSMGEQQVKTEGSAQP